MRKSTVLSFSVTVEPANSLSLSRPETFSDSRQSRSSSWRKSAMSLVEGGLGRYALGFAVGAERAGRRAHARAGTVARPRRRSGASARVSPVALQIADGAQAILGEPRLRHLADAQDQRHRLAREEGDRLGAAEHGEAARLVEIGSDLGEELVAGQSNRNGDLDLALDSVGEARQRMAGDMPCRRSVPVRSRNASSIDSGSTSGVRSRISARTSRPTAAYFAMSGRMTTGMRAQPAAPRTSAWPSARRRSARRSRRWRRRRAGGRRR